MQTIKESIPNLVYSVLKEAGKPLRAEQIIPLVAAKGRQVEKVSMLGAIYRGIQKGQLFKLVSPGLFGLLEWTEQK